jgi:hypothetical protein
MFIQFYICSGFIGKEPLDLLIPFSELLSAESGIIRRNMELYATAGLVPRTSAEASTIFPRQDTERRYAQYLA